MVKGVNQRVVVVNNPDNKYFEKVVFFVAPAFNDMNEKRLRRSAEDFALSYGSVGWGSANRSLRKICKRRRILWGVGLLLSLLGIGIALVLIL